MSDSQPLQPDGVDTPVMDPPRIPLRIWHWFVWTFATISLLANSGLRNENSSDDFGLYQQIVAIHWSVVGGLVLTACAALAIVLRRADLPRPLKRAPGHFLLLALGAFILSGEVFVVVEQIAGDRLGVGVFILVYFPAFIVAAVLNLLAIGSSPSLSAF
jgi:hypothetical protein